MMKMMNSKRWLALILTVAMMCASMSMAVFAEPEVKGSETETVPVEYYDENGDIVTRYCNTIPDEPDEGNEEIILKDGWYVVNSTSSAVTVASRICIQGEVHLVLNTQQPWIPQKGIHVAYDNSLYMYRSVAASGYIYNLDHVMNNMSNSDVIPPEGAASIGGNAGEANGNVTIYGGNIQVYGIGKGVGTPDGTPCGKLSVYAGTLISFVTSGKAIDCEIYANDSS